MLNLRFVSVPLKCTDEHIHVKSRMSKIRDRTKERTIQLMKRCAALVLIFSLGELGVSYGLQRRGEGILIK